MGRSLKNAMSDGEARAAIAELLRDAGVFHLRDEDLEADFIAGLISPEFHQLDMDSLAAMEICIGLEANWGAVIVPDDLRRIGSLANLVRIVTGGS
jgi:acyl carrier protein